MTKIPTIARSVFAGLLCAGPSLVGQAADGKLELRYEPAFPEQSGLDRILYLDWNAAVPDSYFVVGQNGIVWRIPRDAAGTERSIFLDLTEGVLSPKSRGHNEEGLLGFAFDPAFADNGYVYVYYSQKLGEEEQETRRGKRKVILRQSVVSRFETKTEEGELVADPFSELVLMEIPQPWGNHNGGTIVFGPDGMLYIALGDGGAANDLGKNGQNLSTLLATIVRVDVRGASADAPYKIPKDNPFVGRDDARDEIWAWGLRNPWRMSFDRETGDLWCADVGQNLWEEVDRIVKGGNYGWPVREGLHAFPPNAEADAERPEGMVDPVAEYHHREGISVTGGYVYRGQAIPELRGRYVYADYATQIVWAVREDRENGKHDVLELGKAPGFVSSFAEEPDGELLILTHEGRNFSKGRIYRLTKAAAKD